MHRSRPAGNTYNNAQATAEGSSLKTELLPHSGASTTLEEDHFEVAYYPGMYFNLNCRHSTLSYRSP